jgi:hypothetical protein
MRAAGHEENPLSDDLEIGYTLPAFRNLQSADSDQL